MREDLARLIGPLASDHGFTRRMRFHQGWWRAFVLCEQPGTHPRDPAAKICSTLPDGRQTGSNFLSDRVRVAVQSTLSERLEDSLGLIDEDRLFNNLLSSQPLAFNFFGEMKVDLDYAYSVLGEFFPHISQVSKTYFEFAPYANYTADNSAFDVAFEVRGKRGLGLIGLECKFTDSFSAREYDKPEYRDIFERSGAFAVEYEEMISSDFNQLFRNQLIAEGAVLNGEYAFSSSGLFCHPDDEAALATARHFQAALHDGEARFRIITYWDLIESMVKHAENSMQRDLPMMLWARYIGAQLSENIFRALR